MLTRSELNILKWLATGQSYQRICEELKINAACFYVHCQHIRQKTGIKNTKSYRDCKAWLESHPEAHRRVKLPGCPTPTQLRIMELFAAKKTYEQIAEALNVGRQTVINQLSTARYRAGITNHGANRYADRHKQVRDYLYPSMDDPAFN